MEGSLGSRPRVCFEVEKVIGISSDGNYQVQYAPAWVSKFHLVGCEHLIEEYLQQQQQQHRQQQQQQQQVNQQQQQQQVNQQQQQQVNQQQQQQQSENDGEPKSRCEAQQLLVEPTENYSLHPTEMVFEESDSCISFQEHNDAHNSDLAEFPEKHRKQYSADKVHLDDSVNNKKEFVEPNNNSGFVPGTLDINVKIEDEEKVTNDISHQSTLALSEESSLLWNMHLDRVDPKTAKEKELVEPNNSSTFVPGTLDINVKIEDEEKVTNDVSDQSTLALSKESSLSWNMHRNRGDPKTAISSTVAVLPPSTTEANSQTDFENNSFLQGDSILPNKKKHVCHFCNQHFRKKNILTIHLRVHTGERPYVCRYCEKGFTTHGNLKKHLLIHTGEKAFQCEYCGKLFSLKHHLTSHLRVHTRVETLVCKVCGKEFRDSNSWKTHVSCCSSTKTLSLDS